MIWRSTSRRVLSVFVLLIIVVVFAATLPGSAAINQQINFQGKLTNPDGTNVTDGTYSIRFRIYNHASNDAANSCAANSCLWEETQGSVSISDGIFQVSLGSVTSLPGSVDFNTSSLFLGVKVGSDPEMTPRIRFTAAPYAFNSDSLDGLDSTSFGQLSTSQTWTGTNTLQPTTNITTAIVRQTSFASATADIFNVQTANSTNILQITGPAANEAAVTLSSVGATRALTLNSASGTIVLGSATTTLQKSGTAFTFDLNNASNSTLTVTNAGAGIASLSVEGGVTVGANQDITTTAGTGTLVINSTVTNASDSAISITPSFTGGATDALTYSGISMADFSPTNAAGTDTVNGVSLGNLTDPGATITSNGINVGTGWDRGILSASTILLNAGAGVNLQISATAASTVDLATFSNSGQASTTSGVDGTLIAFGSSNASGDALHITPSYAGGATDGLTYNVFEADAFSPTNPTGTDTVNGLVFGNLTDPGATITSAAVNIGTGWDRDLNFGDSTPTIRLGATDNTAIVSIVDSGGNTLLRGQDHSTNFGASFEAGAFIDYNSMYVDEFFKDRTQVVADGNQNWGDNTEWNANETGTCTWDGTADAINGITAMVAGAVASSCSLQHSDLGAATPNLWLDADFLPTIVMKVRPSVAGAGVPDTDHQFFAGISDGGAGAAPASGAPTNGIYFSNASDAAGTTGTANWYAVTDNGASVTNTACSIAVDETNFALLVIKVMSTSLVKFYIDANVSDGVSLTECGTGNTTNINTAGMTSFLKADWDANSNASTLDIDYYRVWQDDAPTTNNSPIETKSSSPEINRVVNQLANPQSGTLSNSTDATAGNTTVASAATSKYSNNPANSVLLLVVVILGFIFAIYKNHKSQTEIRRLSSTTYITDALRTIISDNRAQQNRISTQRPSFMTDIKSKPNKRK